MPASAAKAPDEHGIGARFLDTNKLRTEILIGLIVTLLGNQRQICLVEQL